MSFNQDKKVILITGAGSEKGKNTALRLLRHGQIVYCADKNLEDMKELEFVGGNIIQMDITKEEDIKEGVKQIIWENERIDFVVFGSGAVESEFKEAMLKIIPSQFEEESYAVMAY